MVTVAPFDAARRTPVDRLCGGCERRLIGMPNRMRAGFVIHPADAITRATICRPMHPACALGCVTDLPDIVALWQSIDWRLHFTEHGLVIDLGRPRSVQWFSEGGPADPLDVIDAIEHDRRLLSEAARHDRGPGAALTIDMRADALIDQLPGAVA